MNYREEEISKRQMDSNRMEKDRELKRLGFVRIYAINTLVFVSNLYDYAKNNSGSLKSAVGTVENAVTAVVGPVYDKFKGVPDDLLVFLDDKVDEAAIKFDERAPPYAKQAVSKAQTMVHKASEVAQTLVQEAQAGGPFAAAHYTGVLFMQFFWSVMVRFWFLTNQVPLLREVAQMAAPTMAHGSEKYNETVKDLSAKGYTLFSVFPHIPIDDLAKVYKKIEAEKEKGHAYAVEEETHKD
ncbi:hypothetical protein RHGRI_034163 [Rhododendron griersonianum]|uniref:REF/SRPP-like protein n=1 Tax=Rhododendron griersonianum TaxID=479676 RepID=A0AAV6HZY0_9ERIC|nr:hypothetical protein RHGRI_034163 [Rhododendron griersonianum]